MTQSPQSLVEEFPEKAERIHLLSISDPRFGRIAEQYQVICRALHRSETSMAPVEYTVENWMRRERSILKDEISAFLT